MILVYNIPLVNITIQLPFSAIKGELSINWGDNTINNELVHTYNAVGTYTIIVSPTALNTEIGRIGLDRNATGIPLLRAVKSWGKFNTVSLNKAFANAKTLIELPSTLPSNEKNEPIVTNISGMFISAEQFNQDISGWDVSSVTDMSAMFFHSRLFNQDISKWNISNVKNFTGMFVGASSFKNLENFKYPKI